MLTGITGEQGRWVGLHIPDTMKLSAKTTEGADNSLHPRLIPNPLPAL